MEPRNWQFQERLSLTLGTRADLHREMGANAITEQEYLEILAILEPLEAQAGPDDRRRLVIAWSQTYLADIYARTSRVDQSRTLFASSGRTWKELCAKVPGNPNYIGAAAEWCMLCPFEDVVQAFSE